MGVRVAPLETILSNTASLTPTVARIVILLGFVVSAAAGLGNGYLRLQELGGDAYGLYRLELAKLGLAPDFLIAYFLISEGLIAAAYAMAGLIIAWRGAPTRATVFAAIAIMLYGITVPPPMHALVIAVPPLPAFLALERSLGIAFFIIFLYVFPDGRFTSWRPLVMSAVLVIWALLWPFIPALNPYGFPEPWPFVTLSAVFATGALAQLIRYFKYATPIEKQQTKWVVYGLAASVFGDFICHAPWQFFHLHHGQDLIVLLVHQPFFVVSQLAAPIGIAFSVLRYGLWEIDFVVNRTLVYALATSALAIVWEAVNASTSKILETMMGESGKAFASGTAVVVTGLVLKPTYQRLEKVVDRRFSPRSFVVDAEFPEFTPELRSGIPLHCLTRVLVTHAVELTEAAYGVVYLCDENAGLQLSDVRGLTEAEALSLKPSEQLVADLLAGAPVATGGDAAGGLAIPLTLPRDKRPDFVGVLLLGPPGSAKGYSSQDLAAFKTLGEQAGTAIYLARIKSQPAPLDAL